MTTIVLPVLRNLLWRSFFLALGAVSWGGFYIYQGVGCLEAETKLRHGIAVEATTNAALLVEYGLESNMLDYGWQWNIGTAADYLEAYWGVYPYPRLLIFVPVLVFLAIALISCLLQWGRSFLGPGPQNTTKPRRFVRELLCGGSELVTARRVVREFLCAEAGVCFRRLGYAVVFVGLVLACTYCLPFGRYETTAELEVWLRSSHAAAPRAVTFLFLSITVSSLLPFELIHRLFGARAAGDANASNEAEPETPSEFPPHPASDGD